MYPVENRGISVSVKNTSFNILTYKKTRLDSSWDYKNVMSPYTRIYFPIDGEGEIYFNGKTILVEVGKIYVIPTMTKFSCKCNDSLEKIFAHVCLVREGGADVFSKIDNVLVLEDVDNIAKKLNLLYKDNNINAVIESKFLIFSVLIKAIKQFNLNLGKVGNYSALIRNAVDYINDNLSATLRVGEVAEATFVSGITLQKRFKKELAQSVGKYIDEKLMTECAKELTKGKLNIGEISDKFGFCDRFYFSRKFTAFYGVSPKVYAKLSKT